MKNVIEFLDRNKISYLADEPMKNHTTFRIGGNAKLFVNVNNKSELSLLLSYLNSADINHIIIGNGSNLLVSDDGIDSIVIRLCGDFEEIKLIDEVTIEAGAGVNLAAVCKFALSEHLTGLEFAYGIPGSIGGAVYMNAGAYGGQMMDVLQSVCHMLGDGTQGSFNANELDLGYRKSVYSYSDLVITSAVIKLKKGNHDEISDKMNELMQRRIDKQPLSYPSAGSVFKRPEGYFAGALIEQCGLKGTYVGGAAVSEKHAGFIINKGDATCKDVLDLIALCQEKVKENFGVTLEREIKLI